MVSSPLGPIAIRSARRPLGKGTSHIANRSWRQNSRGTPRATSAAMGGPSTKQSGIGIDAIPADSHKRRTPVKAALVRKERSTIEDVFAERTDTRHPLAWRNTACVKEELLAHRRGVEL